VTIHQEIHFESETCADIAATDWLYTPPQGNTVSPDSARYNAEFAIFPDDLQLEPLWRDSRDSSERTRQGGGYSCHPSGVAKSAVQI
jgi:hypothetical protein